MALPISSMSTLMAEIADTGSLSLKTAVAVGDFINDDDECDM